MKMKLTITVDVDVDAWANEYGISRDEVSSDVRELVEQIAVAKIEDLHLAPAKQSGDF